MLLLFSLYAVSISVIGIADQPKTCLPFWQNDKWVFKGTGKHQGWADRRDLFVLYHPWEVSQSNCSGTISQEVQIPKDWEGRIRLHFYMTDDYDGKHPKLDSDSWLGQVLLIGHRFKQLLVDDQIVWESDVADSEGVSVKSRFSVLLPEHVRSGSRIKIGFRLVDKVGSSQRLPQDYRHIGTTDSIKESDPWRFMTHLYIGDVTLTPESIEKVKQGKTPSAKLTRQVHERRWQIEPYGQHVKFLVQLELKGIDSFSSIDCAVRCGVPLPSKAVYETNQVVLRNESGSVLPLQVKPMNYWSDGSLRWVELDTIVTKEDYGSSGKLVFDISDSKLQKPMPPHSVSVISNENNEITLSTDSMKVTVGGTDGILLNRMSNGNILFQELVGIIEIEGKTYKTITDSTSK